MHVPWQSSDPVPTVMVNNKLLVQVSLPVAEKGGGRTFYDDFSGADGVHLLLNSKRVQSGYFPCSTEEGPGTQKTTQQPPLQATVCRAP